MISKQKKRLTGNLKPTGFPSSLNHFLIKEVECSWMFGCNNCQLRKLGRCKRSENE